MSRQRVIIASLYLVLDSFLMVLFAQIAYLYRFMDGNLAGVFPSLFSAGITSLPAFQEHLTVFLFFAALALSFLNHYRLYATTRGRSVPDEILAVFKSVAWATLFTSGFIFLTKSQAVSRLVFGGTCVLTFLSLSTWRFLKRLYVQHLVARGFNNLNALIVGAGTVGRLLAEELEKRPYLGLRIVGFLDDREFGQTVGKWKVIGKTASFKPIVDEHFVDEVFVTIPSERRVVSQLLLQAANLKVRFRIVPDLFDKMPKVLKVDRIGLVPLVQYQGSATRDWEMMLKRFADVLLSLCVLLILSPLFALISLAIVLDSPGPVFYTSERLGRKGRPFRFFKFRSMYQDAEQRLPELLPEGKNGPVFKMKNDPRVTRLGRFLRKYSLDELPQLWNVLIGDMSLVGPRPPLPREVQEYEPWQRRRLSFPPGITGLWQVSGRSNLPFKEWARLDILYIENWSLWLDFKILLKTVPAVLAAKGAY